MSSRVRLAGQALAISVALGGPKAAPVGTAPAPLGREASAATPKYVSAREPEGRGDLSIRRPATPISVARTYWVAGGRAAAMSRIELPMCAHKTTSRRTSQAYATDHFSRCR